MHITLQLVLLSTMPITQTLGQEILKVTLGNKDGT